MHAPGTLAGYILVGGQSTRMGSDKALLEYEGHTLVDRIAGELTAVCDSVTLVGGTAGGSDWPALADCVTGCGPSAGILTALRAGSEWSLIVACDMPAVNRELFGELISECSRTDVDCIVPVGPDGREHPLCALYHARCLPGWEAAVDQGIRKVRDIIKRFRVARMPVATPEALRNVNTPAEWQEHLQLSAQQPSPHYIEFRHLYKTFDKPVLVDCSFWVDAGETVAIIGRSGVGKSVTLSHIMGFLKPDEGQVIVSYQDITRMTEPELREIRKRVTMVFQNGALFDSMTVAENILFSLELREDYNEENKEEVVDGLLSIVDLVDHRDAFPTDLSTGHRRAVAIARALAAEPHCILYDEPTTMVDPIMSDHLGNLMLRLKTQLKLTSVVVTHDLQLMRKVADRVVFLFEGKVIYFGPVDKLEEADHPHIEEFLSMDRVELA